MEFTREQLENELKQKGFDGLYLPAYLGGDPCGCLVGDLFPCGSEDAHTYNCKPGYKIDCDCDLNCDWHIAPKKKEQE